MIGILLNRSGESLAQQACWRNAVAAEERLINEGRIWALYPALGKIVEDSVTAADDKSTTSKRSVGKPNTRLEVILVSCHIPGLGSVNPGNQDGAICRIEIG